MSIEYKIQFNRTGDYDSTALFKKLPSPIQRSTMTEIYKYRIERDGFYFIDHRVNSAIASVAFKQFVDEALRLSKKVQILKA